MNAPENGLGLVFKLVELGAMSGLFGFGMFLMSRLVGRFGGPFIEAQNKIAESMSGLAEAVKDTKNMMCDMIEGDRSEHREIIITLQVLADEVKSLRKELIDE